jgi:hypothetical protein
MSNQPFTKGKKKNSHLRHKTGIAQHADSIGFRTFTTTTQALARHATCATSREAKISKEKTAEHALKSLKKRFNSIACEGDIVGVSDPCAQLSTIPRAKTTSRSRFIVFHWGV